MPHTHELHHIKKQIPWLFRLGSNRELKRLTEHLHPDESIINIVTGRYSKGRGLLTLTNTRLIFTYDGWVNTLSEGPPLEHISSIEWSKRWFRGTITVFSAGSDRQLTNIYHGGREIVLQARRRMHEAKSLRNNPPPQKSDMSPWDERRARLALLTELLEEQKISINTFQQKRQNLEGRRGIILSESGQPMIEGSSEFFN